MSGGWRIASVRGVPITIHSTALLLAGLYAWVWAEQFPAEVFGAGTTLVVGVSAAVGVAISILLHELGHVGAGRLVGSRAVEVSLWGLGGMAKFAARPRSGGAEVLISVAGPAVTLALSGVLYAAASVTAQDAGASQSGYVLWYMLRELGWWNLFIGFLNLAPGPPLDGGGVVRGIAWMALGDPRKAVRIAAVCGLVTAALAVGAVVSGLGDRVLPGSRMLFLFVAVLLLLGAYPVFAKSRGTGTQPDERVRLLQDAHRVAAGRGDATVGSLHLLIALSRCGVEPLASFLYRNGVTSERLRETTPSPQLSPGQATGEMGGEPLVSEGAKRILEDSAQRGPGVLGVFLALPEDSEAAAALVRLGLQLPALKAQLLRAATP